MFHRREEGSRSTWACGKSEPFLVSQGAADSVELEGAADDWRTVRAVRGRASAARGDSLADATGTVCGMGEALRPLDPPGSTPTGTYMAIFRYESWLTGRNRVPGRRRTPNASRTAAGGPRNFTHSAKRESSGGDCAIRPVRGTASANCLRQARTHSLAEAPTGQATVSAIRSRGTRPGPETSAHATRGVDSLPQAPGGSRP
jgi:hypothetical protein